MHEKSPSDSIYLMELTVVSFLTFTSANFLLFKILPVPAKIAQMEDIDQKVKMLAEYASNFCSLIHAIAAFCWGLYILTTHGLRIGVPNIFEENLMLAFCLGYFLSDTLFSLLFHYNGPVMMLHHYLTISIIVYVLVKNQYSGLAVYSLVLAEASNPFNLIRVILDESGSWSKASLLSGLTFAVIFIYCRPANKSLSPAKTDFSIPSKRCRANNQASRWHHVYANEGMSVCIGCF